MDYLVEAFNAERKVNNEYIAVLLQKMKALEAAAPKWISVNDDEPELGVNVLTVDGYGHIHTACRVDENIYWREDVDGYLAYFSASYWMPLPEPPKEE